MNIKYCYFQLQVIQIKEEIRSYFKSLWTGVCLGELGAESVELLLSLCSSEHRVYSLFIQSADLCRMNNSTVTLHNSKVSMSASVQLSFSFGR